jgi:fatty acid-binding protein DegV
MSAKPIFILTDSASGFTAGQAFADQIDGVIPFKSLKGRPTPITIKAYESHFYPLAKQGTVIHISISSGLSDAYDNAAAAALNINQLDHSDQHVFIIDSKSVSAGQQLIVYEALKLRAANYNATLIAKQLIEATMSIRTWLTVDAQHLIDSGHCPKILGRLMDIAKIRPLIRLNSDGQPHLKALPTNEDALIKHLVNSITKDTHPKSQIIISHAGYQNLIIIASRKINSHLHSAPKIKSIDTHLDKPAIIISYFTCYPPY